MQVAAETPDVQGFVGISADKKASAETEACKTRKQSLT
jgi:hypothetical protein